MRPEVARMTLPRPIMRSLAAIGAVAATAALAVGTALAADQTVNIVGLEFQPPEITVNVGDTVTWEVTESIGSPHSVTSGEAGTDDEGALFDSGPSGLANVGETFQHTFEAAGTFPYFCTVHGESMSGEVVVIAAGASAPAGEPEPNEGGEAEGIPPERKLIAAAVLGATLVVLLGAAAVWRRLNPA
jgi:plastocyanin